MAQFSEVLAKKALDAIKGTASDLAQGVKQAIVPGFIQSASNFIAEVKKEVEEANKKQEEEQKKQTEEQKKQTEEQKKQTKQEKKQSQYLGDSNKWLDQLAKDTRIMRDKLARDDKFTEENASEKRLLDEKMLSTLEDIRDSLSGTSTGKSREGRGAEVPQGESGDTNIIGGVLGRGAPRPPGSPGIMSRLLTGLKGFGAGALRYGGTALSMLKGNPWVAAASLLASGGAYALTREDKDKYKVPTGAGANTQKSPIKTQGEFLEKTKKYFGGSEEVVTKLTPERVQKYITDVSKKETKTQDPDNEINPTSYAMGKIQLMPSTVIGMSEKIVKKREDKLPIDPKDPSDVFAGMPNKTVEDKQKIVDKWKKLSPEEKQKFYTAYVKQNYESLTGAIGRAPTESEFYAAQFGVTNVANAIKNQNAPLTSAQNAAAVANASALGVKPASPAGAQQDANRQGVATAQQNKDAAQEEANRRLREIGEASNRLKETEKNLKTVDTAYQVQKETYDSLSKKAKLTPEEQAKRDAASKRMQDLNFESESLKALRKTQEDELENAQRTSIQAGKASDQAASVLLNQRQVTSEQNAVLEAEKQKQKAEKEKTTREQIAAEYARKVAAAQAREKDLQPITMLVGVDRGGRSLTEPIERPASILPITPVARSIAITPPVAAANTTTVQVSADSLATAFDIATGGQGGIVPSNAFVQQQVTPAARSIAITPPVAAANTDQTQATSKTIPMVPSLASPLAPGLLPLSGSLDFGQTQLYTPAPEGSGTNTQKFEAKTTVELILDSLKKIEQNTSKTAQGQAEANKRAEKDRGGAPTGRGRGTTTVPFRPTLSGKTAQDDAARDRFYTGRFARIIESTGTITKNLISRELNKLFFPKGQTLGVSGTQGNQLGFLANVAGRELKLGQRSTQFLSKLFGDKVGRAYGGVTGEALGLGIEQFAGKVGRELGFGEGNKIFNMGQILGNFAGNKKQRKLGREQLIYNLTGIPTGATTIFREVDKYFPGLGLKPDPNTGKVSFETLANAGGKLVSQGLSSLFGIPIKGFNPNQPISTQTQASALDIATGGQGGTTSQNVFGQPGAQPPQQSFFDSIMGGLFKRGSSGTAVPNAPRPISAREQNAFLEANGELPKQLETTNDTLADQSTRKDDQGFFGGMIDSIAGLGRSLMGIFTGAGGGSGGFGGGGGMGGGGGGNLFEDFLGTAGNILSNVGTLYLSSKLTKNIKNPTTRMLANLVVNQGLQYGLKTFVMPALGSAFSAAFPAAASALVAASPKIAGMLNVTGSVANPGALYGPTTSIPTNSVLADAAAAGGGGGAAAAGGGAAAGGASLTQGIDSATATDVASAIEGAGGGTVSDIIDAADQVYQGAGGASDVSTAVSDLTGGVDLGTVTGSNMDLLTTGGDVSTAVSDLTGGVDLGAFNDLGLQAGQAIDAGVIATDTPFALANDISGASDVAATASSDILGGLDLSSVGAALNVLTIGYKLSQGQYGSAAGQAIGYALGGPLGAFVGSIFGGAIDDIFGSTPHRTGYSQTKGNGWDRSFGADDENKNENYQKATDTIAKSAQTILNSYAQKVGSNSKFDVAVAIGSDNNDPSFSIYKIFKDGATLYDSGMQWGLTSYFPDAVKEFVAKRMNGPLVDAMKSLNLTEAQRSDLNKITDFTQTSQIADYVNKGATDASLLDATYANVTAENAGYDQVDFVSGGESGNDSSVTTSMVYSLKDKAFVPIKETVSATSTYTDDTGNSQQYTYQTADKSVLGYDENGNPIRAADLNRKVGTATAATTVTGDTVELADADGFIRPESGAVFGMGMNTWKNSKTGQVVLKPMGYQPPNSDWIKPGNETLSFSDMAEDEINVTSGGTASAAPASGGATAASSATVTADTKTPVTDYYNQTQQSFNATMDNADSDASGGNNTAVIAPTNVVDNSVRTNTTIVNTDTRNSDPVLFRSSRRVSFVD